MNLPVILEKKNLYNESKIGEGGNRVIYDLRNGAVGRFKCDCYGNPTNGDSSLKKSYFLMEKLFKAGISVPTPKKYGELYLTSQETNEKIPFIGEEMEKIDGITIDKYFGGSRHLIIKSFLKELKKARDLGFILGRDATSLRNGIYSVNRGIVLLDFDGWRFIEQ